MIKRRHKQGFSLIETVLSISIFLVTIVVLVAMLGPILTSLDEVKKSDELPSVIESLNTFLQADSSLAENGSHFDLVYEAVRSRGFATVYVFRSYISQDSSKVQLTIGFSPKETTSTIRMARNAKVFNFKNAAGPIYRAIITNGPQMPKQYFRDRGKSAKPRYYLTTDRSQFKNNYLPLQISLYMNDNGPAFEESFQLNEILKEEPVLTYSTIINR